MIRAEFFDIFGIFVFLIILMFGVRMMKSKKKMPLWAAYTLIIIGVLGLIVDTMIVIRTYLIN